MPSSHPCPHLVLGAFSQDSCTSAPTHIPQETSSLHTHLCPLGYHCTLTSQIWHKSGCIILAPKCLPHPCICGRLGLTAGPTPSCPRVGALPSPLPAKCSSCDTHSLSVFPPNRPFCLLTPSHCTFPCRSRVPVYLLGPGALVQQCHNSGHQVAFMRCQAPFQSLSNY